MQIVIAEEESLSPGRDGGGRQARAWGGVTWASLEETYQLRSLFPDLFPGHRKGQAPGGSVTEHSELGLAGSVGTDRKHTEAVTWGGM